MKNNGAWQYLPSSLPISHKKMEGGEGAAGQ